METQSNSITDFDSDGKFIFACQAAENNPSNSGDDDDPQIERDINIFVDGDKNEEPQQETDDDQIDQQEEDLVDTDKDQSEIETEDIEEQESPSETDDDLIIDGDDENIEQEDDQEEIPTGTQKIDVPSQLIFDPVKIGRTTTLNLLIKNIGDDPLLVTKIYLNSCSDEFSITTNVDKTFTINKGQPADIVFAYRMFNEGMDECDLVINSNDPNALTTSINLKSSYIGTPTIKTTPTKLEFENWNINEIDDKSKIVTFIYEKQQIEHNAILRLGPFSLEDTSGTFYLDPTFEKDKEKILSPGERINLAILFGPDSLGDFSNNLVYQTNAVDGTRATGKIQITGKGVAPQITASETGISFGDRPLDKLAESTILLTNTGEATANIATVEIIEGDTDNEITCDPSGSVNFVIEPGKYRSFKTQYQPINAGSSTAKIRIKGDFYPTNEILIPVSGNGVDPDWSISPDYYDFGMVSVFTSATKRVRVTNESNGKITLTGLKLSGSGKDYFRTIPEDLGSLSVPISVGSYYEFDVYFTPEDRQEKSATLAISTDSTLVSSISMALSGKGKAPTIEISRDDGKPFDNSLFFEQVRIGDTKSIDLLIENKGEDKLSFSKFSIDTTGQHGFSVNFDKFSGYPDIEVGNSGIVTVVYDPTVPPNQNSADISITTNDPDNKDISIHLTGVGINPSIQLVPVTTNVNPYDFGRLHVENTYGPREFIISNGGTGPLTIESIEVVDTTRESVFTVTGLSNPLPYDVDNANQNTSTFAFGIEFSPLTAVSYTAKVKITSTDINRPETFVYLAGEGLDCPECRDTGGNIIPDCCWHDLDDNKDDCEYYCCYSNNGIEKCDNIDNDCDGQTDEDFPVNQECDGIGECGLGKIECHPENAQFTICSTDKKGSEYPTTPPEEICDEKDNDCDGITDNGFKINESCEGIGECGEGVFECLTTEKAICSTDIGGKDYKGSTESCNNKDDNCDGKTDETFPVGDVCNGIGECGAGTRECDPKDDSNTICSTDIDGSSYAGEDELCNNKDDNCDGKTDEDLGLGVKCNPPGECREGIVECNGLYALRCSTGPDGSEDDSVTESCDDKDNDCDNETDEDFNLYANCHGAGICGAGYIQCDPLDQSETICSTEKGGVHDQTQTEVCDELDNNCNGVTDENFGTEAICTGEGECGQGTTQCDPNDTNKTKIICSTEPDGKQDQSGSEICDGKDNDCDGETDEEWNIGDPCVGSAACPNGTIECATDNSTRCSTDPGGSAYNNQVEICDGIDNDCNDQTDEGFGVGNTCTAPGECGEGKLECDKTDNTNTICSTGIDGSDSKVKDELCDSKDNDCDGKTDEDFEIGTDCQGIGECPNGKWQCLSPKLRVCSTNPGGNGYTPVSELCDNKDNDCDGQTDENFNLTAPCNGVGACGEGTVECDPYDTSKAICSTDIHGSKDESASEKCNNIDDDCDGTIDENFNVGKSCNGIGECGLGTIECNGLYDIRCSTDLGGKDYPNPAPVELCDSKDNDCDGLEDEDFFIGQECNGVGACGMGIKECHPTDETKSICSTDIDGSQYPEIAPTDYCDDIDNDCDGSTDEDYDIGTICTGVGECPDGQWQCDPNDNTKRLCSTSFGGGNYAGNPETCNEKDDDCNGITDDGLNKGALCKGLGVCKVNGLNECDGNGGIICSVAPGGSEDKSGTEKCNTLDDNCDGETDEGFNVNQYCEGTGECPSGVMQCKDGDDTKSVCSTDPGGSQYVFVAELCDEKDNDCNSLTDEAFNLGQTCQGIGECPEGEWECKEDHSGAKCSTNPGGSEYPVTPPIETCNEKDDDCDGQTDEGFIKDELCDGKGICGEGVSECADDGTLVCSSGIGGSGYKGKAETCNGFDDDCDGQTDEDFPLGQSCTGTGYCANFTGTWICSFLQEAICSVDDPNHPEYKGVDELCDTLDNDCDSETDEIFGIGNSCFGTGECGEGVLECKSTTEVACSTDPGQSQDQTRTEVCNDKDDNCNGIVDDFYGSPFVVGDPCYPDGQNGVCPEGIYECFDTQSIRCSTGLGGSKYFEDPPAELCDNFDNDCDGQTDEDFQLGFGCNGIGECRYDVGQWWCNGTDANICSVQVKYVWDDCNIYTNPIRCVECDPQEQGCIENTAYAGNAELCNNLDDDCDDKTDEDFICDPSVDPECDDSDYLGNECGTGTKDCGTYQCQANPGVFQCKSDYSGTECYLFGSSDAELWCDGKDDDCDCQIDEDFNVGDTCTGIGECGQGQIECATLTTTRCSTNFGGNDYPNYPEVCDGKDNDCDNFTDENFSTGATCDGIGECGTGMLECDPFNNSKVICSTELNGTADQTGTEICNYKDDDCDGSTDEDFNIDQTCPGVGICPDGVYECDLDTNEAICSTNFGGTKYAGREEGEICNTEDDDCDGSVDEEFGVYDPQTGERLHCNGSCGHGLMECITETASQCSTDPGGSSHDAQQEKCNYIDDNCNGQVDEGFDIGQSCNGVGTCSTGTGKWLCHGEDAKICSANIQYIYEDCDISTKPSGCVACDPSQDGCIANPEFVGNGEEVCNDLDDDCDNRIDEDFSVGNDYPCTGTGECANITDNQGQPIQAHMECATDSTTRCSSDIDGTQYPNLAEICDEKDNNCDGNTDEGFNTGQYCDGIGACRLGVYECDGLGNARCSTNPGGSQDDSDTEICDNKDNNCDGRTDEDFNKVGQTCYPPCGSPAGTFECGSDGNDNQCSTAPEGSEYPTPAPIELCNGLDDNCDGATDNGIIVSGESINVDDSCTAPGECGNWPGTWECKANFLDRAFCSTGPGGSLQKTEPEICDGKDNDCDTFTDETFDVGGACPEISAYIPSCGYGHWECNETNPGVRICDTYPGGSKYPNPAPEELCNGIDDNCDDQIDEGFDIGTTCQGEGECGKGTVICASETTTSCSTDGTGSPEKCDGKDNDCDGSTDEDFQTNEPCEGEGECGTGVYVCNTEFSKICSSEKPDHNDYGGTDEICDGKDNDCDGTTDDEMSVGSICEGKGICGEGVIECSADNKAICSTEKDGSADQSMEELCDGLDNDCDGYTDEIFPLGQTCTGTGQCSSGIYECGTNGELKCSTDGTGTAEECDFLDNDCDGLTDEDFNIGHHCQGNGECGEGLIECNPETKLTRCSSNPGGTAYSGSKEACDGIDNDCDNRTDEDFLVGETCNGIGECGLGEYECNGIAAKRCNTNPGGTKYVQHDEVCDGKDNDCNGLTDEGYSLGAICTAPGECGVGKQECDGNGDIICSTAIGGSEYPIPAPPEVCNELDDDCDGATDEDLGKGDACNPPPLGICPQGINECDGNGGVRCSTGPGGNGYGGRTEECNQLDDNCDGETDEGFGIGTNCEGIGECGAGTIQCHPTNPGLTICSTDIDGTQYSNEPEICDTKDNDCDGYTDELWLEIGNECFGQGGCSNNQGVVECKSDGTGVICSADPGGSDYNPSGVETCDGRDNNCDGQTDEGFGIGDTCTGVGECGEGVIECDDNGGTQCSSDIGGSQTGVKQEICDEKDNNCNGETDEYYPIGNPCTSPGICGSGNYVCADRFEVKCDAMENSYPELCDKLDNDCDGKTDEDFNLGDLCWGVGECGAGEIECDTPQTTRCSTSANGTDFNPQPEICDHQDNNCDGQTDEIFDSGDDCAGIGICGAGKKECYGDHETICDTHPNGSKSQSDTEICDGLDNDCDGKTDEGYYIGTNCEGIGICPDGVLECDGINSTRCSTAPGGSKYEQYATDEVCDLEDNDCDGQVDEDFYKSLPWPGCTSGETQCGGILGTTCEGQGACSTGFWECADDQTKTRCSTATYTDGRGTGNHYNSTTEICDGIDNDCDGQTDEGFNIGETCDAVGACPAGKRECDGPDSTKCSNLDGGTEYQGTVEKCDNIDNDCDGANNEGYNIGQTCDGVGVCPAGNLECNGPYSSICSTAIGGSEYSTHASDEVCDSQDNDCDGYTDEFWPKLGDPCSAGGQCGAGIWRCKSNTNCEGEECYECSSQDNGIPEICDKQDNNCDGETDETFNIGTTCFGVGVCGKGAVECHPEDTSQTVCSTDPKGSQYNPADEICDYLDNNCDGETDESFRNESGQYDSPDHCGACDQACDIQGALAECIDGQCHKTQCKDGYFDVIGDEGCECRILDEGGDTCIDSVLMPNGDDLHDMSGGTMITVNGQLADLNGETWYKFHATDSDDNVCDLFNIHVGFANNPGFKFQFDVYRGGCLANQLACPQTDEYWENMSTSGHTTNPVPGGDPIPFGECPCGKQEDEPGEVDNAPAAYPVYCIDDTNDYFVRVYYQPYITEATCDPFTLQASNARYSPID